MAETERSQIPGAGADQAPSDELEDLEAPDADIKGGGVNGAGGGTDPNDLE